LEKQSTNVLTYSEQFDNAVWSKSGSNSVTANAIISPDGTTNADFLVSTATNTAAKYAYQVIASTATPTATIYAKAGAVTEMMFYCQGGNGIYFNLTNGAFIAYYGSGSSTITSYSSVAVGNGWYRYSLTFNTSVTSVEVYMSASTSIAPLIANGDGFYLWGAQAEASSYPTSYIPTTSASATRVKDLGSNDVFGSTYTLDADFCLFQDFECFDFSANVFWSGGNYATSGDFRSYIISYNTSNIALFGVNEVATAQLTAFTFAPNTRYKLAVRRVGSTISWFVNGVKYSNASGTTTTTVKIRSISGASLGGINAMKLNEAVIFEDATLTDADCISLTTI
jgi:hypothetical protein